MHMKTTYCYNGVYIVNRETISNTSTQRCDVAIGSGDQNYEQNAPKNVTHFIPDSFKRC